MTHALNHGSKSKIFTVVIPNEVYEDLRAMTPKGFSFRQYAQQILREQIAESPTARSRADRNFDRLQAMMAQTKAPTEDDPISA